MHLPWAKGVNHTKAQPKWSGSQAVFLSVLCASHFMSEFDCRPVVLTIWFDFFPPAFRKVYQLVD